MSKFLHKDDNHNAKAIATAQVFSKNIELIRQHELRKAAHIRLKGLVSEMC